MVPQVPIMFDYKTPILFTGALRAGAIAGVAVKPAKPICGGKQLTLLAVLTAPLTLLR